MRAERDLVSSDIARAALDLKARHGALLSGERSPEPVPFRRLAALDEARARLQGERPAKDQLSLDLR